MGRGIAEVALGRGGFDRVVLHDTSGAQLAAARDAIAKGLGAAPAALSLAPELSGLADCDFIVEAVPERLELKAAVFAELGRIARPGAVLASNTSSIPIGRLAAASGRPESVAGLHFMNPAPKIRGVEVIRGERTSDATFAATSEMASRLGKEAVASRDRAGFVVNRILIPAINDAVAGAAADLGLPDAVDRCSALDPKGPRLPMGPLMLADLIGLDTVRSILQVFEAELGAIYAPSPALSRLVEAGALGAKSGQGFYNWQLGRPRGASALAAALRGARPAPSMQQSAALARRSWLAMLNEAARVAGEGTSSVGDVDRGAVHCLNHREGPLAALDRLGIPTAIAELSALEREMGPAYAPAPILGRLAAAGMNGQATGKGFFLWEPEGAKPMGPNPAIPELSRQD